MTCPPLPRRPSPEMRWLVRMSRWVRNPPSEQRMWLVFGVIAACLAIYGIEQIGWWPDWATAQKWRR